MGLLFMCCDPDIKFSACLGTRDTQKVRIVLFAAYVSLNRSVTDSIQQFRLAASPPSRDSCLTSRFRQIAEALESRLTVAMH